MNQKEKPKWFRPTSNVGFHKIFCTPGNDELVLQLLNASIDDCTIVSFERLDPHHNFNVETTCAFDLYCTCQDGSHIIVEMQNRGGSYNFMRRALAYSALAITDQAKPGWQYDYSKVYFVGLLNYNHFRDRKQAVTKVRLRTDGDFVETNDYYLQIFIELPKLAPGEGRLFLCALRDIGTEDHRPNEYAGREFDLLYKASRYEHLADEEQDRYEHDMSTEQDTQEYIQEEIAWGIKKGIEKGIQEGFEKGMEKGMEKGRAESARNLKALGVAHDIIAQATGLSLEEVERL